MSEVGAKRWTAVAEYRTEHGVVDVHHDIDEIDELQDILERGPHWGALVKCTITYAWSDEPLTVEKAEAA